MEHDTGAAISSMPIKQFQRLWPGRALEQPNFHVRAYFGHIRRPVGRVKVQFQLQYGDVTHPGNLYLFDDDVDAICGRQWLAKLGIDHFTVNNVRQGDVMFQQCIVNSFSNDFFDLFTDNLGVVPNYKETFKVANVKPIYLKPRPLPYAREDRVDEEIDWRKVSSQSSNTCQGHTDGTHRSK